MDWTDILRCPRTGAKLCLDEAASVLRAESSDTTYPVVDGIVDFCPGANDRIATAYDKATRRYDSCMMSSTVPMKVVGRIVWGLVSDRDPISKALALLPEQFDGVLLDVPVGTGVFTASLYRRYRSATIIGVDISMNMLRKAKARFQKEGVNNVLLVKADAAHLPVRDGVVGMVLSMNGWHAFDDKQRAVSEMGRVLRKDGRLLACGYVQGARRLSDWFVNRFGVRNGFFTPPFFTFDDMNRQFTGFAITQKDHDKSFAWFEAVNEGTHVIHNPTGNG
ncbi:MAG: methyltransferase domain-containing protein [Phycisphaerales bacterium]